MKVLVSVEMLVPTQVEVELEIDNPKEFINIVDFWVKGYNGEYDKGSVVNENLISFSPVNIQDAKPHKTLISILEINP